MSKVFMDQSSDGEQRSARGSGSVNGPCMLLQLGAHFVSVDAFMVDRRSVTELIRRLEFAKACLPDDN